MKQMYYMGVDISKEKVDIALMDSNHTVLIEKVIRNNEAKLASVFHSIIRKLKIEKEQLLICCEETGIYKRPLQMACVNNDFSLWVELALKIKKASSSIRGKSDRQDAIRIAEYACRYSDKQVIYKEPEQAIQRLQALLNTRESLIDEVTRMKQRMNESKRFDKAVFEVQEKFCKDVLKVLAKQIAKVEKEIDDLTTNNPEMKNTIELVSSIPGIGKQTALQFIVYTKNFTQFESANHLACYAGVAPFPNESGTIVKRARISQLANKKLKKLLHLAAMAAVKCKGELKAYYIRKVQEGKNKMLVLNNVRNKLIKRMFAVMKRKTEYISINFEITFAS